MSLKINYSKSQLAGLRKELKGLTNAERAKASLWFFKNGPGEYGEGDLFLGLNSAQQREISKKFYQKINIADISVLLKSKFHEERQIGLFILVLKYKKAEFQEREKIFKFYLANTRSINNWDLVDCSCRDIVGWHLWDKDRKVLYRLAKSKNLWERRIAIISTSYFIGLNQFSDTLKIAKILLNDKHDLIHKAVGWMLREVGKRNKKIEEDFLKKYYHQIPRTTLRYAIEKFPEPERQKYLKMI